MNSRIHQFPKVQDFGSKTRHKFATKIFEDLRELSVDGPGVSRATYGSGETAAMQYCADLAEAEGLTVSYDEVANLVIELPGKAPNEPHIICGSHLDSVPQGGNFDGAAGVIAGLISVIRMKREGVVPPRTVRVMALRGEESAWFGQCYLGSGALFGELTETDLNRPHRTTGKSLESYMADVGAKTDAIRAGDKFLQASDVAGYIELHIEQGPVMVARDMPVAVVTGLRGNIRHQNIVCRGEAGHAGAVPRWLRHDAVLATADLLHRFDSHWAALQERGLDLVLTTGMLSTNSDDHAMSRIPGECSFCLEIRSQSIDTLEAFYQLIRTEADNVGRERGVTFDFDERSLADPAVMDDRWIKHLLDCCKKNNLEAEPIPSGAGHDAAVFANAGIPSAMIFIRNENGSHNPNESMEIDDFMYGIDVLYTSLLDPPL
ncbi:MAG: Zn-dependent hydrolase [Rhodospirillaceae bacterium]|nr:Zn-dependent hydrolase [Rhodospirillaceae bacterium]|tara:strand:+ start:2930 stop:4228 length:1299 start_codon:yes stop_codon:yes gene_type:complete